MMRVEVRENCFANVMRTKKEKQIEEQTLLKMIRKINPTCELWTVSFRTGVSQVSLCDSPTKVCRDLERRKIVFWSWMCGYWKLRISYDHSQKVSRLPTCIAQNSFVCWFVLNKVMVTKVRWEGKGKENEKSTRRACGKQWFLRRIMRNIMQHKMNTIDNY